MTQANELLTLDEQHFFKMTYRKKKRSGWGAFWLWLLLGWFGGHHYYLRQYKVGSAMLAVAIIAIAVGWFTWYLLLLINLIWWLYDGYHLKVWVAQTNAATRQQCIHTIQERRRQIQYNEV
ncbi:TM2 domain-containing protein [Agrilactobacillus fermenti]|uniref:TM2 domain-containing protein n=1 Tax=Agrilactobacillus fermenti TaxID=2586909 RepID=UPI003A5C2604